MPGLPGVEPTFAGTPARIGYRPVSRAAREGEQIGAAD
jgi:hypothetical protein